MSKLDYISASVPPLSDIDSVRRGIGGSPQSLTQGGVYGSGSVGFADKPTAADTITLNGIWVEFTASASDETAAGTEADPLLVNLKADLTLTIDECETVLNAAAHAELIVATYANSAGTALSITYDTYTTASQSYTIVASSDTPSGATMTGGQYIGEISLDTENNTLSQDQSVDQAYSLGDASEFTKKTIVLTAKGSANAVITPDNFSSTTITLDTAGDYWRGVFVAGVWQTISSQDTVA